MTYVRTNEIAVAEALYRFVNEDALPGTGIAPDAFWKGLSDFLTAYAPRNRALLDRRDALQARIDGRSEEHTSELQSLMRISYAVFCLKKKTTTINALRTPNSKLNTNIQKQ